MVQSHVSDGSQDITKLQQRRLIELVDQLNWPKWIAKQGYVIDVSCPIPLWPEMKPLIKKALEIPVPYDDPLIIPTSLKTSKVSWGDCKAESWDD
jgi:hypothetical protein